MALLSKSCVYGLRATIYVATRQAQQEYVPIREIARELKLSFHFLTKILQTLTEDGLLRSYRGPSGGVALARSAGKITLLEVVNSLEGKDLFRRCVLGLARCGDRRPCPLHETWARHREDLQRHLGETKLDDLAALTVAGTIRLGDE
mgnify:CR=1 FL=1|jgi:Rrf2 family iron-sulfur cluster assembly transcriptional regulator